MKRSSASPANRIGTALAEKRSPLEKTPSNSSKKPCPSTSATASRAGRPT